MIWAALLFDSRRSEDAALQQSRKDVSNLAIAFREHITGIVSSIDELMVMIVVDHTSHPGTFQIPEWVRKSTLLKGLALQVSLIGPNGIIQASSLDFKGRIDLSDRPHFRYQLDPSAPQPYISVPVRGRVSEKWSVQFTRRLTDDHGQFDGVVVVSVDPFYLSKFFDSVNLGENGNGILVGRDGIVRARRAQKSQEFGQDLTHSELFLHLQAASAGTYLGVGKINGTMSVIGYASLGAYPLVVGIAMPTDDILAAVRRQRSTYLIVGGITTIAIMMLTWFLIRQTGRSRQQELALHAQRHIREQKAQLDIALDNMSQGLVMFDAAGRLVVSNDRYRQIYNLPSDLVKPGCSVLDLLKYRAAIGTFTGNPDEYVRDLLATIAQGKTASQEVVTSHDRIVSVVNKPIPNGGWVATHEDVTVEKRAEERITYAAKVDALTGLPNRRAFCEQLEQALQRARRGERLALLYFDLDHLKRVNDTLGHPIGDKLLKAVAQRLCGCIRSIDLIARLSGDEFAIIQASIDQTAEVTALAMRVRETIHEPFVLDGHQVIVDVSIGISIAPNDATELDELLKAADIALYEAKNTGRGTYCYYELEMNARIQARSKLERDLQNALAKGEFELFYQPVVNLEDYTIGSFEALLRWRHPERGLVYPTEFIPIAEEMGLIIPLGEWVVRTACAEAATWPDNINVAVNISSVQLTNKNLVNVIINAIASARIPAGKLTIEITETVLLRNTDANLATLNQLHDLGVRLSMDDFGTGYSSLGYLLSFPFSKIKIDRSFIVGLPEKNESRAIVRAIADLAANLSMRVVAEGVETEKQLEQVQLLGCTEIQGYLFSAPRLASRFTSFSHHTRTTQRASVRLLTRGG